MPFTFIATKRGTRAARAALLAAFTLLVCACTVIGPTLSASAVDAERIRLPIVAGTELQFPGANCTAGLVVVRTGVIARLSQYQRAVRYVVTAKHCGAMNEHVSVGGEEVGYVSWVDPAEDLELVRIEPQRSAEFCAPSTSGFHCSGPSSYTPRAVGKVLLATLQYRYLRATAVAGTGSPADGELFCISGKSSGQSCTFAVTPWRPSYGLRTPGDMAAIGQTLVFGGDSGAPVVSHQAKIYGILAENSTGPTHSIVKYVRISHFFQDAGGYALAPA